MDSQMSSKCRVCLRSCDMTDFSIGEVSDNFMQFSGYLIHISDPQKICHYCHQQVQMLREFKETCDRTEMILEKMRIDSSMHYGTNDQSQYMEVKQEFTSNYNDVPMEVGTMYQPTNYINTEEIFVKPEIYGNLSQEREMQVKQEMELPEYSSCSDRQLVSFEPAPDVIPGHKKVYMVDFTSLETAIIQEDRKPTQLELFVLSYKDRKVKDLPPNEDDDTYEQDSRYICDNCDTAYKFLYSLREHLRKCMSLQPSDYICPNIDCRKDQFTKNVLKYHLETSKCGPIGPKDAISCSYCDSIFTVGYYARYIAIHGANTECGKKNRFNCNCGKLFATLDDLRLHCALKKCTILPLYEKLKCDYCEFSCCFESNIKFHMERFHPNASLKKCECGQESYCEDLYLQHIIFRCTLTSNSVKEPFSFMLGSPNDSKIRTTTDYKGGKSERLKVNCKICDKAVQKRRLTEHMNVMHNISYKRLLYQCDICKNTYTEKTSLKYHIVHKHMRTFEYSCTHCERVFTSRTSLVYHTKKFHVNQMDYVCEVCAKRFTTQSRLRYHASSHTDERIHPCPECNKSFKNVISLATHKRNNHGNQLFPCPVCQKKFKNVQTLRQHRLTHEPKSYICPVCSTSFSVSYTLRGHMSKHHPEYPMPPVGTKLRGMDINLLHNQTDVIDIN